MPQEHTAINAETAGKIQRLQQLRGVVDKLLEMKGVRPDLTAVIDDCVQR